MKASHGAVPPTQPPHTLAKLEGQCDNADYTHAFLASSSLMGSASDFDVIKLCDLRSLMSFCQSASAKPNLTHTTAYRAKHSSAAMNHILGHSTPTTRARRKRAFL